MKNKAIQHVFFDLDHTLWDFDKNSALTFDKIFKLHKVGVNLDSFLKVYEPVNLQYWKRYRNEEIDKIELRYGRLRDTFDEINFSVEDGLIHNLSTDYIEHLSSFSHLFEGTLDVLQYLQPKYQLHIITNGFEEAQLKKMDSSAITSFFKTITNAEVAGVKKPNPIIFDYALKIAKAEPNESIMIGDNYEADILGALNVGYDAIFFNYRNDETEPHIKQIKHLSQLKQYL
ncbi:putative hydrolase of the HAD superfamily [Gelidibacter algens]|jgi:putative hydrolase of the HAD superfamily|uniref:Putative hydrolase of the HAD superfamily n=1 Tax=Gelidibacter algens TaxID=49280 RepID=A0A1A7QYN7_9FLAO|nr:YjjG family noncanonical pyrimidine nucleotidase [Gelidibacter algens]OBX24676.1 noncanonical pyrimidine nucleotidase, YjjG family [Gelidibacter algens]RAJ20841.1 putative hydrolase of the HAD superfamily [Gelidibacter algens]